ncbi:monovalent cation:H+ antiporter, CPA1 family [Pseudoalteromonas luteoviolacea DSM 6061]|nr:monovalent cation:H+ antiporter, CPA1 family [Pseudoalteromonas luteoviolacea DSM 6061]
MVREISIIGSLNTRSIHKIQSHPTTRPIINPTKTTFTNSRVTCNGEVIPSTMAPENVAVTQVKNNEKNTIAVPSFSSDSPSISVSNLLRELTSFKRATTATGSVALMSAPNIKHIAQLHCQESGVIANISSAVSQIASIRPGTASNAICVNIRLNKWTSIANALSKMRVGRNKYRNKCESISAINARLSPKACASD